MLRDHLDEVFRSGMGFVLVAVVRFTIIVSVLMECGFIHSSINVVVMRLSEKMAANTTDLEDEQRCHQHSQPPTSRSWFGRPSA